MFDWNDMRYFLELARRGKLAAAALRLGVDHTTVSRRIAALEKELGVELFDRENRAYKLNSDGRRLMAYAEKMEASSLALMDEVAPVASGPQGTVRLSTPEAFGSQFLVRHCMGFRQRNPGITLELVAETRSLNLSRREADAAITLARPSHGRIVSEKAGVYRLRLYAAPSYLQQHPPIVSLPDLKHHHFIWYVDDLLPLPELQMLDKAISDPHVIFRTTSVTGQANAAEAGLGIALLPCYLADRIKGLTPVLPSEISVLRDLWLVVHDDLRPEAHMDRVCTFLTTLIASERRTLLGAR
ncbi:MULTISPECIES: LysR family transcriptional regulator [Kordiimonas]|jgi:DNA-binding transcriptional LysR family regulator|uniref:LysR family transcriptional regulator n=1 Tax=Kordiimonas TaxID=288021 RepID=UPI00257AE984|nr:LysR family transcriptional regulator [Kordiimonas sp. UBA4487]